MGASSFDLKSLALLGAVTVTSIALALGIAWTLLNMLVTHLIRGAAPAATGRSTAASAATE